MLYDSTGQKMFHRITHYYIKKLDITILVFYFINKKLFKNLEKMERRHK